MGPARRDHHLLWLHPDVLAAVRARLSRHAAAISPVRSGVSGAERDVDGRRVDPGGGIRDAVVLFAVVVSVWPHCGAESVDGDDAGMADPVAAAAGQFRGD